MWCWILFGIWWFRFAIIIIYIFVLSMHIRKLWVWIYISIFSSKMRCCTKFFIFVNYYYFRVVLLAKNLLFPLQVQIYVLQIAHHPAWKRIMLLAELARPLLNIQKTISVIYAEMQVRLIYTVLNALMLIL